MKSVAGQLWQPRGMMSAEITFDEVVSEIRSSESVTNTIILPAPVDGHLHGGGGFDCMEGEAAIRAISEVHAKQGLGGFLVTTVTAPEAELTAVIEAVQRVMTQPDAGGARVLGVHLEGPFINPGKRGAQPDHVQSFDMKSFQRWIESGVVKVVTLAPECAPEPAIELCEKAGVKVQLGHSLCEWHTAKRWIERGAGITHLYNAMSGAQHRDTGLAGAALAYADHAEIICDGEHVTEPAFMAARRAVPGLYSVSDATSAAGMPDGEYRLGDLTVFKKNNRVELADGTLAGSCLTAQRSIGQLRDWGLDWHEIGAMTAARPAAWLGLKDWGSISTGQPARFLVMNPSDSFLILDGQRVEVAHAN